METFIILVKHVFGQNDIDFGQRVRLHHLGVITLYGVGRN